MPKLDAIGPLGQLTKELQEAGPGWSDEEVEVLRVVDFVPPQRVSLGERFAVPPFSVLDARQGYWQARKRAWLALGIQSELGRGENDNACPGGSPMPGKGSRSDYEVGKRSDGTYTKEGAKRSLEIAKPNGDD